MKIKHMIFLILILCSVAPLLLISGLGIQAYSDRMEALLENSLKSSSSAQESAMEVFFVQRDNSLTTISDLPEVRQMLDYANQGDGTELENLRTQIDRILDVRIKEYMAVERITVLDQKFRIVSSTVPASIGQVSKIKQADLVLTKGRTLFTDLVPAEYSDHGKNVFAGIRPVYAGDELIGYVIEELNLSFFELIRANIHMLDTGSLHLVDSRGHIIMAGNKEMNLAAYEEQERDTEDFHRQWKAQGAVGKPSGFLRYMSSGEKYLTYYTKLNHADWRLFVSVNLDRMIKRENSMWEAGLLIGMILVSVIVLVNYMISKRLARPIEALIMQIKQIKANGDVSTRIQGMPDNEIGMIANAFNRLLDYIEQSTNEQWRSKEKLHIIMNQTNHIFVEWNYEKNTFSVSPKFYEMFGYRLSGEETQHGTEVFDIHPDDFPEYRRWFGASYQSETDMRIELRMRATDGVYLWVRLVFMPIFNQSGKVTEAIGLISNIDKEKREVRRLQEKAELDSLTGLLNRGALKNELVKTIQRKKACALLFIDIDDFKNFNTNYGHLCGDQVLWFVARVLKKHVAGFTGRHGGDEFVACITQNAALRDVEAVAERILKETSQGILLEGNGELVNVYCSIGIAHYPQIASTYEELLQKADEAMYKVKESGKNNYFIIT